MTLPLKIVLADLWEPLIRAWTEAFSPFEHVAVRHGDFFAEDADALVSPANSFGIMDGGLDAAIRAQLGGASKLPSSVASSTITMGSFPSGQPRSCRRVTHGGRFSSLLPLCGFRKVLLRHSTPTWRFVPVVLVFEFGPDDSILPVPTSIALGE